MEYYRIFARIEVTLAFLGQQEQALAYFRNHAGEWASKVSAPSSNTINVVKQRNDYVLHVIDQRHRTELALDVGCGTGDLVLNVAGKGIRAVGVDFAPEMIQIATEHAAKENLDLAQFYCTSIFEFDMRQPSYDCISANGFIEYISSEQLLQFIAMAYQGLNRGGSLVIGSRNRLFNLFSLNDFTVQEIEAGSVGTLLKESIAIAKGTSLGELLSLQSPPLPGGELTQPETGIAVSMRLQYTPVQIMKILNDTGFEVADIYPIHVHGVLPQFKDLQAHVHMEVSNLLQGYALGHRELIPQASSFMIHAKKAA